MLHLSFCSNERSGPVRGCGQGTGVRGKKESCDETPEQIVVKRESHLREQRDDTGGLMKGARWRREL
jgi:hypothetical protein